MTKNSARPGLSFVCRLTAPVLSRPVGCGRRLGINRFKRFNRGYTFKQPGDAERLKTGAEWSNWYGKLCARRVFRPTGLRLAFVLNRLASTGRRRCQGKQ
jgi:hypothetical protein